MLLLILKLCDVFDISKCAIIVLVSVYDTEPPQSVFYPDREDCLHKWAIGFCVLLMFNSMGHIYLTNIS